MLFCLDNLELPGTLVTKVIDTVTQKPQLCIPFEPSHSNSSPPPHTYSAGFPAVTYGVLIPNTPPMTLLEALKLLCLEQPNPFNVKSLDSS